MSVTEKKRVSGPDSGRAAAKRERSREGRARRGRSWEPRDAAVPLKMRAQSLPCVSCCLAGLDLVPFVPTCQGQAQGAANTALPVPGVLISSRLLSREQYTR